MSHLARFAAIAALSEGKVTPPLVNMLGDDVMLPGNWEVAYGPKALVSLMKQYHHAIQHRLFESIRHRPENGSVADH